MKASTIEDLPARYIYDSTEMSGSFLYFTGERGVLYQEIMEMWEKACKYCRFKDSDTNVHSFPRFVRDWFYLSADL